MPENNFSELSNRNRKLMQALSDQGARLESLIKLLSAISNLTEVPLKKMDLSEAAGVILEILVNGLDDVENCSLLLFRPDENRLRLLAARGLSDTWEGKEKSYNKDLTFRPGEGIAGWVFFHDSPIFWDPYSFNSFLLDQKRPVPESLACIPLSTQDRCIGVLNISFGTIRPFDQPRRRELMLLSSIIANVLQSFYYKMENEREIVERKRVEDELRVALAEKEILLSEVHHRVKNNLQIISSLFYFQIEKFKDDEISAAFKESQNRIKSIALIHERLYQSRDLTRIDFSEYIQSMVKDLLQSYGIKPERIALNMKIDEILLGVDTAIPFGLIVNELVSNSLKHAFGEYMSGEIVIELQKSENQPLSLIVGDNGIGLPENIDFQNTETLGLRIVNILVKQLKAMVELDKSEGIRYKITLPPPK